MSTDLERWWVRRAHRIVNDAAHIRATADVGASPARDELESPRLRWPGYLGRTYGRKLRVLAVANVHCGFRTNHFDPGHSKYTAQHTRAVRDAVNATEGLLDAEFADVDGYLAGMRPMYEAGLSLGWTVSTAYAPAWRSVGLDRTRVGMTDIAYVNVSCCQVPEIVKVSRPDFTKREIKRLCTDAHPLAGGDPDMDVIAALRPQVIFTSAKWAMEYLRVLPLPRNTIVVPFRQIDGRHRLMADVDGEGLHLDRGTSMYDWEPAVRNYLMTRGLLD